MGIEATSKARYEYELEQLRHHISELELEVSKYRLDEEKLHDREGKYRFLCAETLSCFQTLDASGYIIDVNKAWLDTFGFSREEVTGRWFGDFMLPESMNEFRERFSHFQQTGKASKVEFTMVRKAGSIIVVSFSGSVSYDEAGNLVRMHCILEDITDRKLAEEVLVRNEERFHSLCDSVPIAIFMIDFEGRNIYTNKRLQEISGLSDDEDTGFHWSQVVHPDDRDELLTKIRESAEDGNDCMHSFRIVRPDGELKWVRVHTAPVLSGDGKQVGRTGIIEDCTDIKNAEEKLKENETKYRHLFDIISDAIIIFDAATRQFIDVNDKAVRLYGYTSDEFFTMKYNSISVEEGTSDLLIQETVAEKKGFVPLQYHRKKDGTIFLVEISACAIEFKGSNIIVCTIRDITERIEAEETSWENEQKFKLAFETSNIGMAIIGLDGKFRSVNTAYCCMLGYSEQEMLAMGMSYVTHTADLPELEKKMEELLSGVRNQIRMEIRNVHRDWHTIWVIVNAALIRGSDNKPIFAFAQIQDVSEQRKAFDAIRESEKKYRLISENIPVVVYSMLPDENSTRFFISERINELTGYCEKQFIDDPKLFYEIIHEDNKEFIWQKLKEHRTKKEAFNVEYRIRTKDGFIKWIKDKAKPMIGEKGEITRYDGFMEDITMQRLTEEALHETEVMYKSIVDNIGIGIAVLNRKMEIISVNNQMNKWFPDINASEKQICYEAYNEPPKKEICSYCPTVKTLQDGMVHEALSVSYTHGKERNYRIVASPVTDESGTIIAAIEMVEDMTEKLRIEKEMLKQQKLESLSILASGVAHDFNNILASLLGNLSLAKKKVQVGTELSDLIEEIEFAADRAKKLTRQLSTFSSGGTPAKVTLSISEIIRESADFALHGSNIKCEYDLSEELLPVDVDGDQFSQVINNVVLNALQAMPQGGTIRISGKNITVGVGSMLKLSAGSYVRISVKDNGCGIPEDDLAHIFDPFYSTKKGSSGFGLTLCHTIIKNHDGDIRAESAVGVGTTFFIYLPVSSKDPQAKLDTKATVKMGSYRILALDDDEAMRRLIKRILEESNIDVDLAANGDEAVILYKEALQTGKRYDAVILDLTVRGGMGGKETMSKLREMDPAVKTIVSSGYLNDPVMGSYEEYGFCGRIAKPYKANELEELLHQVLGIME